jgi:hypothetical protein
MEYDAYGNVTETLYDATQTYPVTVNKVDDESGLTFTTTSTFDARFGKVLTRIDANPGRSANVYDTFGRLTSSTPPADSEDYPTKKVVYGTFLSADERKVTTLQLKNHLQSDYLSSEQRFDGLGRTVETRSTGYGGSTVVSRVVYNAAGQISEKYVPCFSTETPSEFVSYLYDELGRVVQTSQPGPDGSTLTTSVAYGRDSITSTDAKLHKKAEYKDAYDRLSKVEEYKENGTEFDVEISNKDYGRMEQFIIR